MWPRRVELAGSRYPRRLRCAALGLGVAALLLSGLPLSLAALAGLAALVPPFRVMLREHWLALHCPRRGWVWVFPDQAGPAALTPLRQVLYLQRR